VKENVQDEYGSPDGKYRRVVVTRHGGPEVLQAVEENLPEPQVGEVRVRVLAAGISGSRSSLTAQASLSILPWLSSVWSRGL